MKLPDGTPTALSLAIWRLIGASGDLLADAQEMLTVMGADWEGIGGPAGPKWRELRAASIELAKLLGPYGAHGVPAETAPPCPNRGRGDPPPTTR